MTQRDAAEIADEAMMVARTCRASMAFCTLLDLASQSLERPPATPQAAQDALLIAATLQDEAEDLDLAEHTRRVALDAAAKLREMAAA